MTEAEWLESNDPSALLEHVDDTLWQRIKRWMTGSDGAARKFWLFTCECCRRIESELNQDTLDALAMHDALAMAENYIEGKGSRSDAEDAAYFAMFYLDAVPGGVRPSRSSFAALMARGASVCAMWCRAESEQSLAYWKVYPINSEMVANSAALAAEQRVQADLLRDIFANPFRPVVLDPAWQTATVVSLAQAIYDERAFDRLPILADALEDAGCTSADILNHCRQPGEHVRGCWAVDLLLGKQ